MVATNNTVGAFLNLGEVEISAKEREKRLIELVAIARDELNQMLDIVPISDGSKWSLLRRLAPLEFAEFKHVVTRYDTYRKEVRTALDQAEEQDFRALKELGPEIERFVRIFARSRHTPDADGYRAYLEDLCPALLRQLARSEKQSDVENVLFPERTREEHTHILGSRKSGKSELMKLLIHHYVKHPELGAVVVIDPHGDLARDVSRWREFQDDPDRLVYLDGGLSDDHFPALNPLAVGGLSERERNSFAVLMGEAIGALSATRDLTDNMRGIARNCLRIVLEQDSPNLQDVVRLLGSDQNPAAKRLLEYARQHPELGEWFSYKFKDNSLVASKAGLSDRLENVLQMPLLGRMLKSTTALDLEALCDAGKVILVGLAGADGGNELGRLMLARVAMIGWRRALTPGAPRKPVHVFVDEAQRMIGPTVLEIMNELRKYGMRLTLAHQSMGQLENTNLQDTLWNGAGVKIIGMTDEEKTVRRLFGQTAPHIAMHEFAVRWGTGKGSEAVIVKKTRSHLRNGRNDMPQDAWRSLIADQIRKYYTPRVPMKADQPAKQADPDGDGFGELL